MELVTNGLLWGNFFFFSFVVVNSLSDHYQSHQQRQCLLLQTSQRCAAFFQIFETAKSQVRFHQLALSSLSSRSSGHALILNLCALELHCSSWSRCHNASCSAIKSVDTWEGPHELSSGSAHWLCFLTPRSKEWVGGLNRHCHPLSPMLSLR